MYKSTLYIPLICLSVLVSCSRKIINTTNYSFKAENNIPAYNNLNYWAAHPQKKDMSDNVPKPLGIYNTKTSRCFFYTPYNFT